MDAYEEVQEGHVSKGENRIASNLVYKLKIDEKGVIELKARIFPYGIRDQQKHDVRKDSSTAQFDVILIYLSITSRMDAVLGYVYITGSYLQSEPIKRTIYLSPPCDLGAKRGFLWKLTNLPYDITESGRQWAIFLRRWLTTSAALYILSGVDQLFVKRDTDREILLLM